MEDLVPFKLWLENHHYSTSTVRNYLVDISKYLAFTSSPFAPESFLAYIAEIKSDPSYSRYFSSLKQFVAYAQDQGLLSTNPLHVKNDYHQQPTLTELTTLYKKHLTDHKTPESTVRNYINDLSQYITWLNSPEQFNNLKIEN